VLQVGLGDLVGLVLVLAGLVPGREVMGLVLRNVN
jgi:hypothetical protein